jgi:hypothetical protein
LELSKWLTLKDAVINWVFLFGRFISLKRKFRGASASFFANEQLNVQLLRAVPFHQASSGSTGPRYFDCNWPEKAESAKESGERRQPDPLGRTNLHVAFARKPMARERDEMLQSVQFHGTFDTRH